MNAQLSESESDRQSESTRSERYSRKELAKRTPRKKTTTTSQQKSTQQEQEEEEFGFHDHLKASWQVLNELKKERIPDELKPYIKKLRTHIYAIDKLGGDEHVKQIELETTNKILRQQCQDYKEIVHQITNRVPSQQDLATAIQQSIATKVEELQQVMEKHLRNEHLALTATTDPPAMETQEQPGTTQDTQHAHHPAQAHFLGQRRHIEDRHSSQTDLLKRTLIIKGRKQETGLAIMELLGKVNFQVGVIQSAKTNRYSVELTFTTKTLKDRTKHELQNNKLFQLTHDLIDQPIQKEKLILIGVPDQYDTEFIKNSITYTHKINKEDIIMMQEFANRRSGKNKTILIPIDEAKQLLHSGGIMLGAKFIPARPYITVQRCRRCQRLGHSDRKCTKPFHCVNCGEAHDPAATCNQPSKCVNCTESNRVNRTRISTNHKASDSNCTAYLDRLQDQKERVHSFYELPPPRPVYNSVPTYERATAHERQPAEERRPLLPPPSGFIEPPPGREYLPGFIEPQPGREYHPLPYDYPSFWLTTGRRPPF